MPIRQGSRMLNAFYGLHIAERSAPMSQQFAIALATTPRFRKERRIRRPALTLLLP